jgi:hypothetical protein
MVSRSTAKKLIITFLGLVVVASGQAQPMGSNLLAQQDAV